MARPRQNRSSTGSRPIPKLPDRAPQIAAPIIVTAMMGAADQAWADQLRRRHYPPERNQIAAHITLFHHLAPALEGELRSLLADLAREPKPKASISGVRSLGNGVAIALLCPILSDMRDHIADRFADYLTPQDRQTPRFHITVQNKVSPTQARATLAELEAVVTPRAIHISGLACWHYRSGPWSPIARYPFRG